MYTVMNSVSVRKWFFCCFRSIAYTTVDKMVQFLSVIFAVLLQMQAQIFIVRSYVGRPNTWYCAKSRLLVVTGNVAELWRFMCFQNGGQPPSWILSKGEIWRHRKLRPNHFHFHVNLRQDVSKVGWVMTIYVSSTWPPAAILNFDEVTLTWL